MVVFFISIKSEHESVNKSILPTEPLDIIYFAVEGNKGLFARVKQEKEAWSEIFVFVQLFLKTEKSSVTTCQKPGTFSPYRPTSNPLIGLTEEGPCL